MVALNLSQFKNAAPRPGGMGNTSQHRGANREDRLDCEPGSHDVIVNSRESRSIAGTPSALTASEPGQTRRAGDFLSSCSGADLSGPRRAGTISHMHVTPDRPGRIILLNGASSSGKTSIAEQLLVLLDPPYFHMSVDAINGMRAKAKTLELPPAELAGVLARTRAGFHRAVAGMAQAGNDVVADCVFSEPWRLLDCVAVLADLEVVFVGVHCSPGELRRRESARGDREPGLAAAQQHQVHAHGIYDIEVDTTSATPHECAAVIAGFLARGERPAAFDRLRARAPGTEPDIPDADL